MKTAILYTVVFVKNLVSYPFRRKKDNQGWVIVVDGGEGAGKDHQLERLKEKYPDALYTREPGGTGFAEDARWLMLESDHAKSASGRTQLLIVNGGRSDLNEKVVEPAALSGRNVVENRGICTTWGYQIGGQQGGYKLKKAFFFIFSLVYDRVKPHLYVILEVDPAEGARRVALRKGIPNHFDERKRDFHERVMKSYRTFGRLYPFQVKFVDANRSKDEVFADIDAIVGPLLAKKPR